MVFIDNASGSRRPTGAELPLASTIRHLGIKKHTKTI
jgi:hypothetical protein